MMPPMLHTAYKVTSTRNAYGDYSAGAETALKCHFRHVTSLTTGGYSEDVQSDALAWFEPASGVVKGNIIKFEGEHFKVERVIKARKLRNTAVQFIKTELTKYGVIS